MARHHLLYFRADPDRQIQRHGVAVIRVDEDWERHLRLPSELSHEFLPIGRDGDNLGAGRQYLVRLHQCIDVDAAIGAPVPAVEDHGNGAPVEEFLQTHLLHARALSQVAGVPSGKDT